MDAIKKLKEKIKFEKSYMDEYGPEKKWEMQNYIEGLKDALDILVQSDLPKTTKYHTIKKDGQKYKVQIVGIVRD